MDSEELIFSVVNNNAFFGYFLILLPKQLTQSASIEQKQCIQNRVPFGY